MATLIVNSLMTVILAKFQALLFQSGIGLKMVNLNSNKHRADNRRDIIATDCRVFRIQPGWNQSALSHIDRQLPARQNIWLLAEYSEIYFLIWLSWCMWRCEECEEYEDMKSVRWRSMRWRCDGDGGLLTTDTLRAWCHHCQSALMDQTGLFHSSWALPVSLSHPSVTPTTYSLQPTAYV